LQKVVVFILHVKKGYEERLVSVQKQMAKARLSYELMENGDMGDITTNLLDRYFKDEMKQIDPKTSCALKHLLVYEQMIERNIEQALVFEDDILLKENFQPVFAETTKEIKQKKSIHGRYMISYENSGLKFIAKNIQRQGEYLYKQKAGRCAGAYLLSLETAKYMIEKAVAEKINLPIDWWHNQLFEKNEVDIYWCEPAIAEQGSHNGIFTSSLGNRSNKLTRRIGWQVQKLYKKYIR
jgi:glycosyl transferase, family 25